MTQVKSQQPQFYQPRHLNMIKASIKNLLLSFIEVTQLSMCCGYTYENIAGVNIKYCGGISNCVWLSFTLSCLPLDALYNF